MIKYRLAKGVVSTTFEIVLTWELEKEKKKGGGGRKNCYPVLSPKLITGL